MFGGDAREDFWCRQGERGNEKGFFDWLARGLGRTNLDPREHSYKARAIRDGGRRVFFGLHRQTGRQALAECIKHELPKVAQVEVTVGEVEWSMPHEIVASPPPFMLIASSHVNGPTRVKTVT